MHRNKLRTIICCKPGLEYPKPCKASTCALFLGLIQYPSRDSKPQDYECWRFAEDLPRTSLLNQVAGSNSQQGVCMLTRSKDTSQWVSS